MGKKGHRFQYLRRKAILSTILADDIPALDDVPPLLALGAAGDRMAAPLSLWLYSHWPANESVSSRVKFKEGGEAIAFRSKYRVQGASNLLR